MTDDRYHRIERQPMGRLISAVQKAGARTVPVGRDGIHAEVVRDGMLLGWLRKGDDGINRLELSRSETPPSMMEEIRSYVLSCEADARRGMAAGFAMAR